MPHRFRSITSRLIPAVIRDLLRQQNLYVGDRRFAEGEVVVLGENFGVRVTRIVSRTSGAELVG